MKNRKNKLAGFGLAIIASAISMNAFAHPADGKAYLYNVGEGSKITFPSTVDIFPNEDKVYFQNGGVLDIYEDVNTAKPFCWLQMAYPRDNGWQISAGTSIEVNDTNYRSDKLRIMSDDFGHGDVYYSYYLNEKDYGLRQPPVPFLPHVATGDWYSGDPRTFYQKFAELNFEHVIKNITCYSYNEIHRDDRKSVTINDFLSITGLKVTLPDPEIITIR